MWDGAAVADTLSLSVTHSTYCCYLLSTKLSTYCHGIALLRVRLLLLPPCEIDLNAPS